MEDRLTCVYADTINLLIVFLPTGVKVADHSVSLGGKCADNNQCTGTGVTCSNNVCSK